MRIGSLFSGIGGFDLAARWIGWETKWYSEIDPYAIRVMERHFPEAYNVGDVTEWASGANDTIDILCGGFPCQPVSCAGKRLAQDDPRWLWPHFARIIRTLRPRYVVAENVPGLLGRGATDVLRDFAAIGYDVEWETIPASAVGAPHKRDRVWFLAYPSGDIWRTSGDDAPQSDDWGGTDGTDTDSRGFVGEWQQEHGEQQGPCGSEPDGLREGRRRDGTDVADAVQRYSGWWPHGLGWWEREPAEALRHARQGGGEEDGLPATQSDVGRVAHGVPKRVDRLRCLGNAIVPQIAYWIFQQIERRENDPIPR